MATQVERPKKSLGNISLRGLRVQQMSQHHDSGELPLYPSREFVESTVPDFTLQWHADGLLEISVPGCSRLITPKRDVAARRRIQSMASSAPCAGNIIRSRSFYHKPSELRMDPQQLGARNRSTASSNSTRKGLPKRMNTWNHDHHMARQRAQEMLEIQPGVFLPLRGSEETCQALDHGYIERARCFSCATLLVCIADADFVICPECKVVSPVENRQSTHSRSPFSASGRSVGLGLRADQQSLGA